LKRQIGGNALSTGRRRYLYTVALLSYVALLAALILCSRELIRLLLADSPSQNWLLVLPRSALASWLLVAGVSAILWGIHWYLANRPARVLTMAAAGERAATVRKAYLYLGQGAALALVVVQAWRVVADVIKVGFGLPDSAPTPVNARLVALTVGAVIALVFWGYLRWETVRDGDFGRESSRAANWRRAYFYLAALAGSTLAMVGAGESVRRLVVALANSSARGEGWQTLLANCLATLAIGAPLAFAAWGTANRLARNAPPLEMNALSRVLLRYGDLFVGTLATLLTAGYLLAQVLMLALGRLLGPYWPTAVAYLPVGLITWLICAPAVRLDVALGGETARTATVRRLVRYTVAGLALAAFWLGLTEFVRLILLAVLRVRPADPAVAAAWWTRFAYAAAIVFVAAPAWWGHWWSQQVRARVIGPAGDAERASGVRQFYLYAVTLAGAAIALAALGLAVFLFLNRNVTGAMGMRAALAGAGAAAFVSLLWAAAHGLTLRGDARWLAVDQAASARMAAAAEPTKVAVAAAPRSYRREDLAAAAAGAGIAPLSARPVAVIDGVDGSVGAAALIALRRALPDTTLWPIGLNAKAQVAMLNALSEAMPPAVPGNALAQAAAILGPSDILLAGSLDGDVTNDLVSALASSPTRLLLLPPRDSRLRWVAAPDWPLERWIDNAVIEIADAVKRA
jgi:hypothetical protein